MGIRNMAFKVLVVCIPLIFLGCNRKATQLGKTIESNKHTHKYFSTKTKVKFTEGETSVQVNMKLKMEFDNVLWASVTKLGKEAVRLKLTPDTTSFLNKYPADARCYAVFPTQEYLKNMGVNAELKNVQNLFLGNNLLSINRKDEVKSLDNEIHLTQVRDTVIIKSKLSKVSSKLIESHVYSKGDTVSFYFYDYKKVQGELIPHKLEFDLSVLKEDERAKSKVEVNYVNPSFPEEAPSFTFKIPSSYEECK